MDTTTTGAVSDQEYEFAQILLAVSPACPRAVRERLPTIIHALAVLIYGMRLGQEHPAPGRLKFGNLMKELSHSLDRTAEILVKLTVIRDELKVRYIDRTLSGPRGIISALGGEEQIKRLLAAAAHARDWQQQVAGPGKHSLYEALNWASAEQLCAVSVLRLRRYLGWRRGDVDNARQCEFCEQLWLLSGGRPSSSLTRWLAHMSRAKGNKKSRTEAVLQAWHAVNGLVEDPRDAPQRVSGRKEST
jgi:hypothetical protein